MKILLIHNNYLLAGGEDEVVASERRLLESMGHEVISYLRHNREFESNSWLGKINFLFTDFYWSFKSYQDIKSLIKQHQFDIAHIHNIFYVISPSIYQACAEANLPVVQTLHNYRLICPSATLFRDGKPCQKCVQGNKGWAIWHKCWKKSAVLTALLARTTNQFFSKGIIQHQISVFIALSQFSRNMLIQGGLPQERIVVKANFLDSDPGVEVQKGSDVIYVGALHSYKGVSVLLEAWRLLGTNQRLKIIGEGPLRPDLEKQAKGLTIDFLGQQSQQDTLTLIRKAKCLVIPSVCYENFPRVLVEAYACGVGVIASRIGALAELVKDGQTGLHFTAGNSHDLKEKLEQLLNNPHGAEHLGKNARQEFLDHYTSAENYKVLMGIYQQAIQTKMVS